MSLWKKIASGLAAVVALLLFVPGGWAYLLIGVGVVLFGAYCCLLWWEDSRPRR
jgi:hypothetical protein